jgi:hypothetical protein
VLGCRARGCSGAGCPRGAVAGAAAGKQPAGGGVGGGLRVLPLACCSQQQAGEGLGHWGGWLSEPSLYCPVIVFGDVVDAQPDDAAGRWGVEQHQTAGHAGTQRWFVVGEDPTQQRQASALGGAGLCWSCVAAAGRAWASGKPRLPRSGTLVWCACTARGLGRARRQCHLGWRGRGCGRAGRASVPIQNPGAGW